MSVESLLADVDARVFRHSVEACVAEMEARLDGLQSGLTYLVREADSIDVRREAQMGGIVECDMAIKMLRRVCEDGHIYV